MHGVGHPHHHNFCLLLDFAKTMDGGSISIHIMSSLDAVGPPTMCNTIGGPQMGRQAYHPDKHGAKVLRAMKHDVWELKIVPRQIH
jgi:hypothetical protein